MSAHLPCTEISATNRNYMHAAFPPARTRTGGWRPAWLPAAPSDAPQYYDYSVISGRSRYPLAFVAFAYHTWPVKSVRYSGDGKASTQVTHSVVLRQPGGWCTDACVLMQRCDANTIQNGDGVTQDRRRLCGLSRSLISPPRAAVSCLVNGVRQNPALEECISSLASRASYHPAQRSLMY